MSQFIARVQTTDRNINQLQTNISSAVSPVLSNPIINGLILNGIDLKAGDNTIDTTLGRDLVGWFIVRQRGPASFYDKQDSNQNKAKTLILNASAIVNVDIYVF